MRKAYSVCVQRLTLIEIAKSLKEKEEKEENFS
jgi:hypothetical protein